VPDLQVVSAGPAPMHARALRFTSTQKHWEGRMSDPLVFAGICMAVISDVSRESRACCKGAQPFHRRRKQTK